MITLIKRLGHNVTMRLKGYRKGLTSGNFPASVDLDGIPGRMRRGKISTASYYKVWYKHRRGELIKKEIKYV